MIPYYDKDEITLYCGDSLEIMKEFPDKIFDITITDPPYGMNFQSNMRKEKHDKIDNDDSLNCMKNIDKLFRLSDKAVYVFCRWNNLVDVHLPKSFIVWVKNGG